MAEKKKQGWIKLYRSMQKHKLWKIKPFTPGQAWIDLLLSACFKEQNGDKGIVQSGELIVSQQELCDKWGWNRQRVRGFLAKLEHDESITLFSTQRATKITICNYREIQGIKTNESTNGTTNEQPTSNQPIYNKNDKNEQECIIIGQINFKLLFIKEKEKLFPMLDVVGEVRKCVNWHSSKGRKIKDWNRAVSNWLSIAYDRSGTTGTGGTGSGYQRFIKYRTHA